MSTCARAPAPSQGFFQFAHRFSEGRAIARIADSESPPSAKKLLALRIALAALPSTKQKVQVLLSKYSIAGPFFPNTE